MSNYRGHEQKAPEEEEQKRLAFAKRGPPGSTDVGPGKDARPDGNSPDLRSQGEVGKVAEAAPAEGADQRKMTPQAPGRAGAPGIGYKAPSGGPAREKLAPDVPTPVPGEGKPFIQKQPDEKNLAPAASGRTPMRGASKPDAPVPDAKAKYGDSEREPRASLPGIGGKPGDIPAPRKGTPGDRKVPGTAPEKDDIPTEETLEPGSGGETGGEGFVPQTRKGAPVTTNDAPTMKGEEDEKAYDPAAQPWGSKKTSTESDKTDDSER